ncbi:Cullin_binding domain-containing protein [Cephalotus follicularis]|uniref:Defective in cullin neddylation protein n=1 Tax=Cephalotus follicularis TaxID=3775 RepID=A0A1Q3CIC8_CEPFO|nr:Cullin_binding domain-containing protein [Cephalotus follicularis]
MKKLDTMPRASKRKNVPRNPSSLTSPDASSGRVKAKTKQMEKIDNLFDKYANKLFGMIDPEGIEALCSDLKVDYTDVRILMLAWKLKAAKQGYFTQNEWQTGLKALKVDTIRKLKKALVAIEKEVMMPSNFEDFYSYAFQYCLTEEKQKGVDIESICELLKLVLGSQFCSQVDLLIEYLKIQSEYKVINLDQWTNFLRFCNEISFPDLENYDDTQAWPLILDNFVQWMREKHTQFLII